MGHWRQRRAREVVARPELISGHPATAAEVWLWHGPPPETGGDPAAGDNPQVGNDPSAGGDSSAQVVLCADDWPMPAETARELAAALLAAAERAEAAAPPEDRDP